MGAGIETHDLLTAVRPDESPVLAVDLDGTLVKTDTLVESVISVVSRSPWLLLVLPFWWLRGIAYLKRQVALRTSLDVRFLPYRAEVVEYLKARRAEGCRLVLATAADQRIARQIADYLGLFDQVLASDAITNLNGRAKRDRLVREWGEKGFDYAGNSRRDLPIWASGRKAILVDPSRSLVTRVTRIAQVDRVFEHRGPRLAGLLRALRPQHWMKNLLVFAPLMAAHRMNELGLLGKLALAFLALGCAASCGYLINDLHDLTADRRHPHKRSRPFASGDVSLSYGLAMIPILFAVGCVLANLISGLFFASMAAYLALSVMYSLWGRRIAILDVIFLAGLYTIRVLAGSAAVVIWPSHWLLAFSSFLFLSLALVKRYGELCIMKREEGEDARARAYELTDAELLAAMGVSSGYLAVLVLALYINSDKAPILYGRYQLIWLLCPLLLYWISDIWLIAHRGKMPDDPVMFAIRDRTSRILLALMFVIGVLAL